ncbi:MAG: hypothetical protein N3F62_06345 [Bacteroidia bacterium]|nr:hypothetical protein [Bacteroidia bacterium]
MKQTTLHKLLGTVLLIVVFLSLLVNVYNYITFATKHFQSVNTTIVTPSDTSTPSDFNFISEEERDEEEIVLNAPLFILSFFTLLTLLFLNLSNKFVSSNILSFPVLKAPLFIYICNLRN